MTRPSPDRPTGDAVNAQPAAARDDAQLRAVAEAVWRHKRPTVLARLNTLEQAATAVAEKRLDADLCARARQEAHRLAGAAGTFGRARASETARALERLFAGADRAQADPPRVARLVAELRDGLEEGP
jgi:chemotaxis protein histidine kinase CheA